MDSTQGWAIWFTGLPASGKTVLARMLQAALREREIPTVLLDSDELRHLMAPKTGYTPAERDWFYDQLVKLAEVLVHSGERVLIAATGNRRSYREAARALLGADFAEVWVRCPLDVCRARDPKGLYSRAALGDIQDLPGVDTLYEAPKAPEVIVDTDRQTPEQALATVLAGVPFLERLPLTQRAQEVGSAGAPKTIDVAR